MYVCVRVCDHSHTLYTNLSGNFSHISVRTYSIITLLLPVPYSVAERPVSSGLTLLCKYSLRYASCAPNYHFTPLYTKAVSTCIEEKNA